MDTNPPPTNTDEPTSQFAGTIERVHGWRSMTGLTIALGSAIFPLVVLSAFGNSLPPLAGSNTYVSELELTNQSTTAKLGLPAPCHTEPTGLAPGTNRVTCAHEGSDLQIAARYVDRSEGLPTLARRALRAVAQVAVADDHPVTTSASGNQEQARIQYQHENGDPVEVAVLRENGEPGAYVIEVQGKQSDGLGGQPEIIDSLEPGGADQPVGSLQPGDITLPDNEPKAGEHSKPGNDVPRGETGGSAPGDVITTPVDLPEPKPADPEAVTEVLDEIVRTLAVNQARNPHGQAVAKTPGRIG